jgi:hypothetical protein
MFAIQVDLDLAESGLARPGPANRVPLIGVAGRSRLSNPA